MRLLSARCHESRQVAQSPSHIFEYDAAYKQCFSQKRLASIAFLTFVQNLHDVIPLVLKKDLDLQQQWNEGPKPSRLTYHTMCLLVRYLANQGKQEFVREFGGTLWGHQRAFRDEVARLLNNYNSGIKGALQEKFLSLDNTKSESLKAAFKRAETTLGLKDTIDVFEAFGRVDKASEE